MYLVHLLFGVGILCVGYATTDPTLPILPAFTTVITRITNNTIDVLHGVTGVVQGGLSMLSSTIARIIDGAGTVRDKIVRLLEEFRKRMQKGIPELGIPILEPLTVDRIDLNIVSPKIGTIKGHASEIEVRRLSEFKIDYVSWDMRNRLVLNITFPRIDVKGNYAVSGQISKMVKVFGHGPFWLKLRGLSIGTASQLRYRLNHNPAYYVESTKIGIKLKKLDNHFSNLMDDEKLETLFNEVISEVTPEVLDMLWPDLEPGISKQIVEIINDKLRIFQLNGFLGRLLNLFKLNTGKIDVRT